MSPSTKKTPSVAVGRHKVDAVAVVTCQAITDRAASGAESEQVAPDGRLSKLKKTYMALEEKTGPKRSEKLAVVGLGCGSSAAVPDTRRGPVSNIWVTRPDVEHSRAQGIADGGSRLKPVVKAS